MLLYICRRTFGFKKDTDDISIEQMVSGITRKDGERLDYGTGLSRPSVTKAVQSLEAKNFIIKTCRRDPKKGDLASTYQLNVGRAGSPTKENKEEASRPKRGGVKNFNPQGLNNFTRGVKKFNPQETAKQKTENTTTKAEVVVALVEWGISQNVSETLAKRYRPERIHEKIDFLKHLIENEPNSVKKPAAWLRKAIEEDYSAPDSYKTALSNKSDQVLTKAERTRKKAVLEAEKAHSERSEQLQKAREAAFTERLQTLFQRFNTSERDLHIWDEVKAELANQGVSDAILTSLQLLKLEKGRATLNVINNFMAQQASQPRVKAKLTAVLSQFVQRDVHIRLLVDGGDKKGEGSD